MSLWPRKARIADDASDADAGVQALISLARMQLLAQVLDSDSADARHKMRCLAFAVVAAVITIMYSTATFA